jgi:membrane-bound ClpP family serine protease
MPEPLQRQIFIRLGFGVLFLALSAVLILGADDVSLVLPCAGAALFLAASAFGLFRRTILGEYVIISGTCQSMILTAAKKRIKYMLLKTDTLTIRVAVCGRQRKISEGMIIDLYIAKSTPVYKKDDTVLLYTYLAIDIGKEERSCK